MGVKATMDARPHHRQSAVSDDRETVTTVSVVVPVKSSHATIRRLCESLLHQTLAPLEIILVGDPDDSTWIPIRDLIDGQRLRTIEVTRPARHYGRDSNLKRRAGCDAACGGIIAVTDSDMVLPKDWLSTGVEILQSTPVDSAAGIILSRSQTDHPAENFLDRYTDRSLLSKTPRFTEGVVVDKETLEDISICRYRPTGFLPGRLTSDPADSIRLSACPTRTTVSPGRWYRRAIGFYAPIGWWGITAIGTASRG